MADSFDLLHQIVHRLGWHVRHLGGVPGEDLGPPAFSAPASDRTSSGIQDRRPPRSQQVSHSLSHHCLAHDRQALDRQQDIQQGARPEASGEAICMHEVRLSFRTAKTTFALMPKSPTDLLRDSVYVTVGLGLITVQKLQVHRRKIEKSVQSYLGGHVDSASRLSDHD